MNPHQSIRVSDIIVRNIFRSRLNTEQDSVKNVLILNSPQRKILDICFEAFMFLPFLTKKFKDIFILGYI